MSTRQIKDAVNHSTGELVYFKGHAKATFMSDGKTVEEAINNIEIPTVPTKTSELTNDSGFITINDVPVLKIPEEYVTETELSQKGFLVGEETSEELDDVETNTYVKYVAQTLTNEQKAQVRNNIGAPSMEQLMAMYQELLSMINNSQNQTPTVATLDKSVLDNTKLA